MEFLEKDAKRMSLEDFLRWLDEMKTADGLEQLVNCILVEGCEENENKLILIFSMEPFLVFKQKMIETYVAKEKGSKGMLE